MCEIKTYISLFIYPISLFQNLSPSAIKKFLYCLFVERYQEYHLKVLFIVNKFLLISLKYLFNPILGQYYDFFLSTNI